MIPLMPGVLAPMQPPPYSPEAQQYIDRMTDTDPTRRAHIATLIDGLVADGIWSKLDILSVAQYLEADSLRDLKGLVDATKVNSPTFTSLNGFTMHATGPDYLNTNYIFETTGAATQADFSMFAFVSGGDGVTDIRALVDLDSYVYRMMLQRSGASGAQLLADPEMDTHTPWGRSAGVLETTGSFWVPSGDYVYQTVSGLTVGEYYYINYAASGSNMILKIGTGANDATYGSYTDKFLIVFQAPASSVTLTYYNGDTSGRTIYHMRLYLNGDTYTSFLYSTFLQKVTDYYPDTFVAVARVGSNVELYTPGGSYTQTSGAGSGTISVTTTIGYSSVTLYNADNITFRAWGVGTGLTNSELTALRSRLNTYLTSIGAI